MVLERAESGEVRIFESRPVELAYFDRREENPTVLCAVSPNNWVVRGWHVDVSTLDAYELVRELTRKKSAAIYRKQEIIKDGAVVKGERTRTWVVFHSKVGYAIVAETSTFKSLTP